MTWMDGSEPVGTLWTMLSLSAYEHKFLANLKECLCSPRSENISLHHTQTHSQARTDVCLLQHSLDKTSFTRKTLMKEYFPNPRLTSLIYFKETDRFLEFSDTGFQESFWRRVRQLKKESSLGCGEYKERHTAWINRQIIPWICVYLLFIVEDFINMLNILPWSQLGERVLHIKEQESACFVELPRIQQG